jgi:hypothetical protein
MLCPSALAGDPAQVTMLEALSHLLAAGYQPARTLMLAIGHDEEVSSSWNGWCVGGRRNEGVRMTGHGLCSRYRSG